MIENEIPKHRKKSNKQPPKKSDHQHDWKPLEITAVNPIHRFRNDGEPRYWIWYKSICTRCHKQRHGEMITLNSLEEVEAFKASIYIPQ